MFRVLEERLNVHLQCSARQVELELANGFGMQNSEPADYNSGSQDFGTTSREEGGVVEPPEMVAV